MLKIIYDDRISSMGAGKSEFVVHAQMRKLIII